jgi:hypothetical protein
MLVLAIDFPKILPCQIVQTRRDIRMVWAIVVGEVRSGRQDFVKFEDSSYPRGTSLAAHLFEQKCQIFPHGLGAGMLRS